MRLALLNSAKCHAFKVTRHQDKILTCFELEALLHLPMQTCASAVPRHGVVQIHTVKYMLFQHT